MEREQESLFLCGTCQQDANVPKTEVRFSSCSRECSVYISFMKQPQKETNWNQIFSHLLSLLYAKFVIRLAPRQLGNGWRRSCFSQLIAHAFCSQRCISHSLVDKKRRREQGIWGNLSSSPLYLWLNILYAQLLKSLFLLF